MCGKSFDIDDTNLLYMKNTYMPFLVRHYPEMYHVPELIHIFRTS